MDWGRSASGRPQRVNARHLFIVSRDQPGLYEFLQQEFSEHSDVDVVLDRRQGERRRSSPARPDDRRQSDRRAPRGLEAEIQTRGYAIVHR
jgi:hypothetical protein